MTEEMIYSVNDVVCLHRCDKVMRYIDDQIMNQMECCQIPMSYAHYGTGAAINQL